MRLVTNFMFENTIPPQTPCSSSQDQNEVTDQIYVGVVASHSLAGHYLCDLIKSNNHMTPVILTDETRSDAVIPSHGNTVLLLDLWGLPLPTSEYLGHFST